MNQKRKKSNQNRGGWAGIGSSETPAARHGGRSPQTSREALLMAAAGGRTLAVVAAAAGGDGGRALRAQPQDTLALVTAAARPAAGRP